MKRLLWLPIALAALAVCPPTSAAVGVTGRTYNVIQPFTAGDELLLLTGCAEFGDDARFVVALRGETLAGEVVSLETELDAYGELDFFLFGFWYFGTPSPLTTGGIHFLFGAVVVSLLPLPFTGLVGECTPEPPARPAPDPFCEPEGLAAPAREGMLWCSRRR